MCNLSGQAVAAAAVEPEITWRLSCQLSGVVGPLDRDLFHRAAQPGSLNTPDQVESWAALRLGAPGAQRVECSSGVGAGAGAGVGAVAAELSSG